MEKNTRFEIITKDRLGITVMILEKIYKAAINLLSVEVFPKKICIKMQNMNDVEKEALKKQISAIEDVVMVNEMDLLNYEENERKLLAILDSVDEGIMVVNKKFEIDIFNNYCEKVFHCKKEEAIGMDIRKLIGGDAPAVELINSGIKYDNVEVNVKTERGEVHYLTTGRPIVDDNNITVGAVASIKDIHKAIEIANVIAGTTEGAFKEIVGNSSKIENVKKIVETVAKSDSTILFRGESGTGKELFAKATQSLSNRKNNPFVTISCAALPDNLIESELFGYEKGSFTGAMNSGKEGLFKEADGGTLFLDEIGELSIVLQAKLLRVLQEGVIRKIGSTKEENVNVRIIAATNRNLEEMIQQKKFREDLYYRLNVIPINIPPLRDRLSDISSLVTLFICKFNKKLNKEIKGAELSFINKLLTYNWPGNIRELQNVIERAMNLCGGKYISLGNLIMDIGVGSKMENKIDLEVHKELKLKELVESCEKQAIVIALSKNKSLRKTAKELGVSHTTIINKIKKYRIYEE
ncbi:sigma 54-interacting transcriptional regulator [Clostridium tagluense]|uniref:sigma 54-interacting transcriptional regulator n=1 Tax=Clostridium TaxID=1485 RepID=UPI0013E98495|nr:MULTISPECIES: sigma 54-interacting transcriptional regulator [Clostridium]MBZ9625045.1 sigma 54-interacting transcriptional regulator [Clostridium sp. FP2]MCB2311788.1 sigma 54-interacting transcriptional regulator [Clostridium tagluense]MCB2316490.1 sigma 54-interacting transcriptional regulator [Clostridium tagluense]MCB2321368.1 sigma 54-interacting transcriptional regulator [Clostridium tagluense]MCB2326359.1 sigma 54-interacting transcriptional regulator [Clostridium tagluense]